MIRNNIFNRREMLAQVEPLLAETDEQFFLEQKIFGFFCFLS